MNLCCVPGTVQIAWGRVGSSCCPRTLGMHCMLSLGRARACRRGILRRTEKICTKDIFCVRMGNVVEKGSHLLEARYG